MVYTRQMTIGNNGNNECTEHNSADNGPARSTRNSLAIASSSQGQCNKCNPIQPSTSSSPPPPPPPPSSSSSTTPPRKQTNFLDLPQEIIEKIFGYLTFKNICQLRFVSTRIDHICGHILNTTFQRLQHHLLERFHEIKRKMPRRESARRNHHLACESDIIETLHMRLTLLQMSLGKHIERKHCCFFPGEILDEVLHILHYIKVTPKLARPYKVTDELFDLSTMAMEYFKEKIEPDLPEIAYFSTDFLDIGNFPSTSTNKYLCLDSYSMDEEAKDNENPVHESNGESSTETTPQSNIVLRKGIKKIKQGMKKYNSQLSILRQDVRSCRQKATEQQKLMSEQQKQLGEQQKQILEYATRMDENEKKNDEISRKFSTLLQELNKCKTELQYWRSKSPATPPFCTNCGNAILPNTDDIELSLINNNQEDNVNNGNLESEFAPIDDMKDDTEQDEQQQFEVTINPALPSSSSSSITTTIKTTPIRANPIPTSTITCENSDQKEDNKSNNPIKKRKLDESIDTPVIRNSTNKKSRRILKGRNYQKSKV